MTQNHEMALREVGALLGPNAIPDPSRCWLIMNVEVELQKVIDLTIELHQNRLRTSVQELTGDWKGYSLRTPTTPVRTPVGIAPTQDLGQTLFSIPHLEGFRTVSAHIPNRMNLIVFPQKLLKGSRLAYDDSLSQSTHEIKG